MTDETGGLRSVDRMIAPAVAETLDSLTLEPEDVGISRLARAYAEAMDKAQTVAAALDRAMAKCADEDILKELSALRAKVSAITVMGDLGPKLLVALDALGATPKSRANTKGGAPRGSAGTRLQALRSAR